MFSLAKFLVATRSACATPDGSLEHISLAGSRTGACLGQEQQKPVDPVATFHKDAGMPSQEGYASNWRWIF